MKKPLAKLTGEKKNIMISMGICTRALKAAGHPEIAKEMRLKAFTAKTYEQVLEILSEYCELC